MRTIYALVDPATGWPVYVGQTRDLDRRARQHRRRWASLGVQPAVLVLEEAPVEDADARERYWIATFIRDGHEIRNVQGRPTPDEIVTAFVSDRPPVSGSPGARPQHPLVVALNRIRAIPRTGNLAAYKAEHARIMGSYEAERAA